MFTINQHICKMLQIRRTLEWTVAFEAKNKPPKITSDSIDMHFRSMSL